MSSHDSTAGASGFRLAPQQEYLLDAAPGAVVQCAVAVPRPVAAPELRQALERTVARHEILRTTFGRVAGLRARQQIIHDSAPVAVEAQVATVLDDATLDVALAREAQDGFDLERGPLLRARVLTGTGASVLILTAAASCLDGPSLLALADELAGPAPDDEPLQFADYAEWRYELATDEEPEAAAGRAFWSERREAEAPGPGPLGDTSPIATISSHTPPPAPAFTLEGDAYERLSAVAARAGVPPSVVLEAIWHIVVARVHGRPEVTVATWLDGRTQPDLEGAIGPYSQPVPVSLRLEVGTSLAEVIDQVARGRARAAGAQDHATAPDLESLLAQADAAVHMVTASGELLALRATPATGLVTLELALAPGSARGQLTGGGSEAQALAGHVSQAITGALGDPSQPAHALPLLSPEQGEQLLAAAAGPAPEPDAGTPFPVQFAAQVHRTPDAIAVSSVTEQLTYAQLDERASGVAQRLRELGAGPGAVVGLCMSRTPAMVAALVGILKAGGAYLPLAPDHPPARRARLLADAGAQALVTEAGLRDGLEGFDGAIVCEEDVSPGADTPPADIAPEDLAYVMFTSGSTGEPKGVQVTHANLAGYTAAMVARLHAREQPLRFGVVSAISTDLGNTAIFPALASGGSLHLVDPDAAMDADGFAAAVRGHELDVLKIAPSHLRAILGVPEALPRRWLVLGGEALSWELVARVRALSPDCRIINHYGPTETTVGCCTYDVDEQPRPDSATVPIGHPLPGVRAYVLDPLGAPAPDGAPGELCIGGSGVAAGYVGPDVQERFVADVGGAGRMYRTGDRVRRLHDGALQFLGRLDDQVKVRGYRVEPGEVEAALGAYPAVRQAAVAVAGEGESARLVAYLVAGDVSVEELQGALGEALPDYMIPSAFLIVDALPLTPSGKVDRRALPELAAAQARREAAYVAPRDEVEQGIAAIWCELLGADRVGVFDDFFALGGHSLLATQAIMRIRREHGDIPLRALLAAPTVAALADVVRAASPGAAHAHSSGR